MENTIMQEVVTNEEVAPVMEQVAKNSTVNGGVIALGLTFAVAVGYGIYKGVKKLNAVHDAKKAEKEDETNECVIYEHND